MAERVNVFISSTSRDLSKYRVKVKEAVLRAGAYPIAMEEFTATERNALQLCYDELQQAEVFIGIYAYRYGYAPSVDITYTANTGETRAGDGETGITHFEYLWAIERNLPILLYIVSDKDEDGKELVWPSSDIEDEPGKSRLNRFKSVIMGKHVVGFFYSPDHLAAQVAAALQKTLPQQSSVSKPGHILRRDFYRHIALPPNYVPRADLLNELRLALLGDSKTIALTSTLKRNPTALHGMGGIGKSVITRALCDDPEIQAAFPDGILWTTLGQEPNLALKLHEWIEVLGGKVSENTPTMDILKSKLAELLDQRACLLVVDDVWEHKHAEAFRVGGAKCRLLMTTRNAEISRLVGAEMQPIVAMNLSEGLSLLEEWARGGLANSSIDLKVQIANRLGCLPLALKLAGAQLQREDPDKWLESFDAHKLESPHPEDIHDSLEQTFGLSLDTLDNSVRHLYATLAIFPEDEPISEAAVARLWTQLANYSEDQTMELVNHLAANALLEVVGSAYPRQVALHDLMRDFIKSELGGEQEYQQTHQKLLDAYRTQCPDGWIDCPDDGYFFEHITYHLRCSRNDGELHSLLLSEQWIEKMRSRFQGYAEYLSDLKLAFDRLTDPLSADQLRTLLQLYTAYTVVGRQANAFGDQELEAFVWLGEDDKAAKLARLRSEPQRRYESLVAVYRASLEKGSPNVDLLTELEGEAYQVQAYNVRATFLSALAEYWFHQGNREKADELFNNAISQAHQIVRHLEKAEEIIKVARKLIKVGKTAQAETLLYEARTLIPEIAWDYPRVECLGELAVALFELGTSDDAVTTFNNAISLAIPQRDGDTWAGEALHRLVRRLAEIGRIEQGLETARLIKDLYRRAWAISDVGARLVEMEKFEFAQTIFSEAIATAQGSGDSTRLAVLPQIVGNLARAKNFILALQITNAITAPYWQSYALRDLGHELAKVGDVIDAKHLIEIIQEPFVRAEGLRLFLLQMAKRGYMGEAEAVLERLQKIAIEDEREYSYTLRTLAWQFAENRRVELAVSLLSLIPSKPIQTDAKTRAAYILLDNGFLSEAENCIGSAIDLSKQFTGRDSEEITALLNLALCLAVVERKQESDDLIQRAIQLLSRLSPEYGRWHVQLDLVEKLTLVERLDEADNFAKGYCYEYKSEEAYYSLIRGLLSLKKLDEARDKAYQLQQSRWRSISLIEVATELHLSGREADAKPAFEEAHSCIPLIEDGFREDTLRTLARAFAETQQLKQAEEIAQTITDIITRAATLVDIAVEMLKRGHELDARALFRQAAETATTVKGYGRWEPSLQAWAEGLAEVGLYAEALRTPGLLHMTDIISVFSHWSQSFEKLQNAITPHILCDAVHILGWGKQRWKEIDQLLTPRLNAE